MDKKVMGYLFWLLIVIVAFWGGRLTAPVTVRVEKVVEKGPETIIYKLADMPLNAIAAYLSLSGQEIVSKGAAEEAANRIKAEEHIIWQSGYKAGYTAGYER